MLFSVCASLGNLNSNNHRREAGGKGNEMKTRQTLIILGFVSVLVLPGCDSDGNENDNKSEPVDKNEVSETVLDELESLGIKTSGDAEIMQSTLPEELNDANWGLKSEVCKEGGYDLDPYAGQTVTLTSFDIPQSCDGELLRVWVVTKNDVVICVYLTVREDSSAAPGVYSVNDEQCKE